MVNKTYHRIYEAVKSIPRGRVTTYGQIARLAGIPGQPRRVGYALSVFDDKNIPWHRVINAMGKISRRSDPDNEIIQRHLLEEEGITFDEQGKISLKNYGWFPESYQ